MKILNGNPALLTARALAASRIAKLNPPPRAMALLSTLEFPGSAAAPNKERELRKFLRRLDASTSRWAA